MNQKTIDKWDLFFTKSRISTDSKQRYLEYIENLLRNNVPIIFDFSHLALLLGKTPAYLASVINSNKSHYREFSINKKTGGRRKIQAPYPTLLENQRWIYHNILEKQKIHFCAQGFTPKKSIITNAKMHLNQKHFLKIDLKDFFPSISINQVINIFKSLGYTHKVSFYLASICCYEQNLPQGAPTSPMLSNLIAMTMDKRLYTFAQKFELKYTRYADDLAFSGETINSKHIEYISSIIHNCGFEINKKKTIFQQKQSKRILTGISIAENELKVPKKYKRALKQEVHYIRKYGIYNYMEFNKIQDPYFINAILGKIQFWKSIEPKNRFALKAYEDLRKIVLSINT